MLSRGQRQVRMRFGGWASPLVFEKDGELGITSHVHVHLVLLFFGSWAFCPFQDMGAIVSSSRHGLLLPWVGTHQGW